MRKYWQVFKLSLEDYFVYRTNFILWRVRSFVFFLTLIFFWQAVFTNKEILFGYSQSQMLAYVVGAVFLRGVVLSSRSSDEFPALNKSGDLAKWLIRPISVFKYFVARDLAAKFFDVVFVAMEIGLVIKIFHMDFYFPKDFVFYPIFVLIVFLSTVLFFWTMVAISSLGFWIEDVWATRWLFGIIFLELMSGVFFPIDVLPETIANIIKLTPFPYLIYFPLKVWNGQVGIFQSMGVVFMLFFWVVITWFVAKRMWNRGLKSYATFGG